MTFAPELFFNIPGGRGFEGRICSNDLQIGVDGGPFTESLGAADLPDRFGERRSQCRIRRVASITDDELVELYVEQGVVAPPPPVGPGQIEVDENAQSDPESARPAEASPPASSPSAP
jgi:hypothetical protein